MLLVPWFSVRTLGPVASVSPQKLVRSARCQAYLLKQRLWEFSKSVSTSSQVILILSWRTTDWLTGIILILSVLAYEHKVITDSYPVLYQVFGIILILSVLAYEHKVITDSCPVLYQVYILSG